MAENEVVAEEKKSQETAESPSKNTGDAGKKSLEEDAFHNFLQGKRHILVQDYTHAVDSLADACELYVKHYGETAAECGEVYYHYGLALFRLFQQQAGILGDVLPGSEEEEEEEEGDEDEGEKSDSEEDKEKENTDSNSNENEVEDDEEEEDLVDEDEEAKKETEMETEASPMPESSNKENKEQSESTITSSSDGGSSDVKNDPAPENVISSDNATIADADSTTADAAECQKEVSHSSSDINEAGPSTSQPRTKSDDISDLQLAWETLETAKSIFKRQDTKEAQLKVADILIILSEISMELENYTSAVEDLNECLHIRTHCLEPDDRAIAETFYQLALAFTYDSKVQPALEYYEKSIEVIKLRIEKLKSQTEVKQNEDGFDIDPKVEIDELEGLLPEIQAKMEDTQDMMPDAKRVVKEMASQKEEEGSLGSTSNKPVSNIGHLLKRKKPEDTEAGKLGEAKKIKLVNTGNGSGATGEIVPAETASLPKA